MNTISFPYGKTCLQHNFAGDGIGGDHFYHQLADEPDIHKTMALFLSRG